MKSNGMRRGNAGIGLIEILITTLVIALGLLAVAQFQVGLIGESRDNKAMVEARNYCESGVEDLRRFISREGFQSLAQNVDPTAETFAGRSASFTRKITIENLPLPGETDPAADSDAREKRITAICEWDGEEVVLSTILSVHDTTNSALASNVGGGGVPMIAPTLNAGSSDDISETVPLDVKAEAGSVVSMGDDGDLYIVQPSGWSAAKGEECSKIENPPVIEFAPHGDRLRARRRDNDGYTGPESIELFEVVLVGGEGGIEYCIPRVRFNGGVVIPIKGRVHSQISSDVPLPVELFTLNVSESGTYCLFDPEPDGLSAQYVCYVGGNCAHGPAGDELWQTDFTQCPNPIPANISANVGEGGWRGKVGLLNVAENYNVCFYEEVYTDWDPKKGDDTRDTAREYFSHNLGSDGVEGTADDRHQGINRPYECHDFLIIDGQSSDQQFPKACVAAADAVGGINLAKKRISRQITGSNVYVPEPDRSNCSGLLEYVVSGGLENVDGRDVSVRITDGVCSVIGDTAYQCVVQTSQSSVEVHAIADEIRYPVSPDPDCTVALTEGTSSYTACTITFPATTGVDYRISGLVFGDPAFFGSEANPADVVAVYAGSRQCELGEYISGAESIGHRPYTCTLVLPETAVDVFLEARVESGYQVTYAGAQLVSLSGFTQNGDFRDVAGPDINVSEFVAPLTYPISGDVTVGSIKNNLDIDFVVEVMVEGDASISCVVSDKSAWGGAGTSGDYECTGIPASNYGNDLTKGKITFGIRQCVDKNQSNKHLISVNGSTSVADTLTLPLGNVNGPMTLNVNVTESDQKCGK